MFCFPGRSQRCPQISTAETRLPDGHGYNFGHRRIRRSHGQLHVHALGQRQFASDQDFCTATEHTWKDTTTQNKRYVNLSFTVDKEQTLRWSYLAMRPCNFYSIPSQVLHVFTEVGWLS